MKETCFVVMGYGKKVDYSTGKTVDLDKVYHTIIQPVVLEAGYHCVRGDEVNDAALIDRSMYALLMHAELVIADITTFNPNAVYELGVRHAARPYSTVIMMDADSAIPFDINHSRIIRYKNLGECLDVDEVVSVKSQLTSVIKDIQKAPHTDSPLYTFINGINPLQMSSQEYDSIITSLAKDDDCLYAIVEKAQKLRQNNLWEEALKYWEKAVQKKPNEVYYLQQKALCIYKSGKPSIDIACSDALSILNNLPHNNNTETLGLIGAVYKRMYEAHPEDLAPLDRAIKAYGRGFKISGDYYTGENYAFCLLEKSKATKVVIEEDERIYSRVEAKKVWKILLENYMPLEDDFNEVLKRDDGCWVLATLSSCLFALGDERQSVYENFFLEHANEQQKATYEEQKYKLGNLLG